MHERQNVLTIANEAYGVLVMSIEQKMKSRVRVARWLSCEFFAFVIACSLTLIVEVDEDGMAFLWLVLSPDVVLFLPVALRAWLVIP